MKFQINRESRQNRTPEVIATIHVLPWCNLDCDGDCDYSHAPHFLCLREQMSVFLFQIRISFTNPLRTNLVKCMTLQTSVCTQCVSCFFGGCISFLHVWNDEPDVGMRNISSVWFWFECCFVCQWPKCEFIFHIHYNLICIFIWMATITTKVRACWLTDWLPQYSHTHTLSLFFFIVEENVK